MARENGYSEAWPVLSAATPLLAGAVKGPSDDAERERILAVAARGGDSDAFRELYEIYRDRIRILVVFWIDDPLHAQDIVQTVFLKALLGIRNFRLQSSPFTWIYRIARNECRDYLRRRSVRPLPLETILGSGEEIDPMPVSNGGDGRGIIVQNAVRRLPSKMKEVIVLKYLAGLSYAEMGRALGCAPGTVASRLNRALIKLEEQLRPLRGLL